MKFLPLLAAALLLASATARADSMRCGSALVSVGDRAWEVEQKCGAPDHRDDVGYTLGGYDRREFKVEEWVYGPRNGATYILTFEANRLKRIEFKRD
ncbi:MULTISPECIES: DUF2845 domain-containing protein [Pseudomonas]|uniref:DUF2845 domain-containing protein n=1 Tax=Pseudomonas delhiensis TaxID=366289 RepID=A0A239FGU3_9PSED|nr:MULTISPECIES: DUF2845 domain-containing protein [Pseudomonas]MED5611845.1 DUF2845 domain-containing protein [Pseudomonas sp. JH-2]PWU29656.1 DUF2845 domain-containing protein [Pseudomonas sp. RW407]SDI07365.1 Protein of unknown function [Pseudomonas delhiensis]SNS56119.1 Protein of unknown function [Pseudomonas delhiensis]